MLLRPVGFVCGGGGPHFNDSHRLNQIRFAAMSLSGDYLRPVRAEKRQFPTTL